MNIDQLGDLFGPRQMRNCLPCKKRKIKCESLGYQRAGGGTATDTDTDADAQATARYHVRLPQADVRLTSGGPCALRRDVKSCTPALNRLEDLNADAASAAGASAE